MFDLFTCIYHLGFSLGWKYWRLNSAISKDPAILQRWMDRLEAEALEASLAGNEKYAELLRSWITECQSIKNHTPIE